jgi:hypothetical protein
MGSFGITSLNQESSCRTTLTYHTISRYGTTNPKPMGLKVVTGTKTGYDLEPNGTETYKGLNN